MYVAMACCGAALLGMVASIMVAHTHTVVRSKGD